MSRFVELIEEVKEEGLSKDALEAYHTEISYLNNLMQIEMANVEKLKAIYFDENKMDEIHSKVLPDVTIKRMWQVTEYGLREIELKSFLKVASILRQSLKTRLYSIY